MRKAIFKAAKKGDVTGVARILNQDPYLLTAVRKDYTLLMKATSEERVGVVELLLERGADARAADSDGETALHIAAQVGHEELVTLLIGSGAGVYARGLRGATTLIHAASFDRLVVNASAAEAHEGAWAGGEAGLLRAYGLQQCHRRK